MMKHWTVKKTILLLIALIVLSCVGFLIYDQMGLRSLNEPANYLVQSLKPGMTRAQVLTVLNHAGPYYIFPQGRGICHPGDATPTEREAVYVHPVWWYNAKIGLYMCYDDSGSLTRFWTLS